MHRARRSYRTCQRSRNLSKPTASGWIGIGAPKGTPAAIIDKLNSNIAAGLADPEVKARIKGLGADPMPMTPTQFGALVGDETEKWAKVVKFAGIKAE